MREHVVRQAHQIKRGMGIRRMILGGAAAAVAASLLTVAGCEVNSFLDPSIVGSWENTPKTMPILSRLDVIDEPEATSLPVTQVQPEDLVPDNTEYVIGAGDLLTITVFELITPGVEAVQTRRVDETGSVRLPVVGEVTATGRTPSQLEEDIVKVLDREGVLTDATVSVVVQESRQNTYSVIGEPFSGSTAFGTYVIPKPDFRILEALALARGAPGRTKKILVFRQTALSPEVETGPQRPDAVEDAPPAPDRPADILEQLDDALEDEAPLDNGAAAEPADRPDAPPALARGLDERPDDGQWVKVGDQWVRAEPDSEIVSEEDQNLSALSELITQRIIEVPYDRLLSGDMRFNIIVRPGDVIRIPDPTGGFVYLMGAVNRPGAYTVPGEEDLTLMQLIASGGNLSGIAIPSRVDLVRRVDTNRQAMVRLNLRNIFEGNEPDIFLKPNDLINVGTNFPAVPLAVFRNGLRATYGFGFVVDRNFETDVFGSQF